MLKDEIILLHVTLYYIKRLFEHAGITNNHFKHYDKLGIQPTHVYKSKADHEKAVMVLCKGILDVLKSKKLPKNF